MRLSNAFPQEYPDTQTTVTGSFFGWVARVVCRWVLTYRILKFQKLNKMFCQQQRQAINVLFCLLLTMPEIVIAGTGYEIKFPPFDSHPTSYLKYSYSSFDRMVAPQAGGDYDSSKTQINKLYNFYVYGIAPSQVQPGSTFQEGQTTLFVYEAKAGDEYGLPQEQHRRDNPVSGKSYDFKMQDGELILDTGGGYITEDEKDWLRVFTKQGSGFPRQRLMQTLGDRTFTLGIPMSIPEDEDLYFSDSGGVTVTFEATEERWHRVTWRFLYKFTTQNLVASPPTERIVTGRLWVDALTGDPLIMLERNPIRGTWPGNDGKHYSVNGIMQNYREWQYLDKERAAQKLTVDVLPNTAPNGDILSLAVSADAEHLMILSQRPESQPALTVWNLRFGGLESVHPYSGKYMRLDRFDEYVFSVNTFGFGSGLVKIEEQWNSFGNFTKASMDWSVLDLSMLNSYASMALNNGKVLVVNPGYDDVLCYDSFSKAPLLHVAATCAGVEVRIAAVDETRQLIVKRGKLSGRHDAGFSKGAYIWFNSLLTAIAQLPFTGEVRDMDWIPGKPLLIINDESGLVHVYDADQHCWSQSQSVGLLFDIGRSGQILTSRGTWEHRMEDGNLHWTPLVKRNLPPTTRIAQAVFDQNIVFYVSKDDVQENETIRMMDMVTGNELQHIQADSENIVSAVASPVGEIVYKTVSGAANVLELSSLEMRALGPAHMSSSGSSPAQPNAKELATDIDTSGVSDAMVHLGLQGMQVVRIVQSNDGNHLAVLTDGTILLSRFSSDQWEICSNVLPNIDDSTHYGEQQVEIPSIHETNKTERVVKLSTYFLKKHEYFVGDTIVDALPKLKNDQNLLVLTAMGNLIEHNIRRRRNHHVIWVSNPFSEHSSPFLVPCGNELFAVVGTLNRPGWNPFIPVTQIRRLEDLSLAMELHPYWGNTTTNMFVPSRNLFVSGYKTGFLRIWDLNSGAAVVTEAAHKESILSISTLQNGQQLLTVSEDGSIKLWDLDNIVDNGRRHANSLRLELFGSAANDHSLGMANVQLSATIVPFLDGSVFAMTPDGYVTCPGNALRRMTFLDPNGLPRDFEEFGQIMQRPDVVYDRIRTIDPDRLKAARQIVRSMSPPIQEKKLSDMKLSIAQIPLRAPERHLTLDVSVAPVKTEVSVWISINSVPVSPVVLNVDENETACGTVHLTLSRGVNRITVQAEDKTSRSRRKSLQVIWDTPPISRNIYAVVAGVSNYQHHELELELKYAAKDAHDIGIALRSLENDSRSVKVLEIPESEVTAQNLRKASSFLRQASTEDVAVLFLAGHGFLSPLTGEYLFATVDTDPDDPDARALSGNDIRAIFQVTQARQRLLLLDSCNSAGIGQYRRVVPGEQSRLTLPVTAGSLGGLEATPMKSTSPVVHTLVELTRSYETHDGIVTLAASAASGWSYEPEAGKLKNGFFTQALLQAITTHIADRDGDDTVTIREINSYISSWVLQNTGGLQRPTMATVNLDNDFWW